MTMDKLRGLLAGKAREEPEEEEVNALMPLGDGTGKKKFKKRKEGKNTVKRALLSGAAAYGAQLVEEVIRSSKIDGSTLVSQVSLDGISRGDVDIDDSSILTALLSEFHRADEMVKQAELAVVKGYITTKPSQDPNADPVYEDFTPFKPSLPASSILEFENVSPISLHCNLTNLDV
jgi:hypothetical protein